MCNKNNYNQNKLNQKRINKNVPQKKLIFSFFFILISTIALLTNRIYAKPATTYAFRSQGAYSSIYQNNLYNPLCCTINSQNPWGSLTVTGTYNRSFNAEAIAHNFFGSGNESQNCFKKCFDESPEKYSTIAIAGSRVPNRPKHALLADYLMLPNDFESTIAFHPTIDSFVAHFNWYINLDRWINGAYADFCVPVVHARTDLGFTESVKNSGVNAEPEGLFTPGPLERTELLPNFKAYASGKLVKPAVQTVADTHFLTIFQQLKNAKISPCMQKHTGVAEIRSIIGWNFIGDSYHAGFNVQGVAPAGTTIKNNFLGETVIGNGNHWEFGAAVNGHYDLWLSSNENLIITLYGQALLTHLFSATQRRTFDLKNSHFSRYMLAQQMDTPHATATDIARPLKNNLLAGGKKPIAQFTNQFAPVANITTLNVDVSANIQADIVMAMHIAYRNFHFDAGYNFWARSADSVKIRDTQAAIGETWTLKGDAQVFGFTHATTSPGAEFPLVIGQPVALSATQSRATVYSGTNLSETGTPDRETFNLARQNLNIDHPELATAGDTNTPTRLYTLPIGESGSTQESEPIHTSLNPIFISYKKDLECTKNNKAGLTSSVFGHFTYMAPECGSANTCKILPHIGVGAQLEFAHTTNTLSQWHAWFTVGFDFN